MASVSQSQGDKYLSWAARERHQLQAAKGTPAVLTTNGLFSHLSPLSIFGPDYWVTMFNMDCSATFNGFFEVKGYYEGQLETDVTSVPCLGFAAGVPPSRSSRGGHLVRCGYQNVIEWGKPDCLISDIPSEYRLK
ncbi:hypothetical protein EGW08_023143 [Elysia chlorotica]|uniref:Uncharacterized protein n=1 Tax=Elysia chlorotica TaxID=188477 RepID=A0A3S0Z884_ELYCH|nr:hypothetical protein EGW08_023143 [Elysia chlorotica]